MYLIGNNFDGQVIDEANYKVFGKKQVVSFNVPKSVISTTKKFIIIASMLHELNHNETVVYGNIVLYVTFLLKVLILVLLNSMISFF